MTSIDNLAEEINRELETYSSEVTEGVKRAVEITTNECDEEIRKHITFTQHSGKYVKAFRKKKTYEDGYKKVYNWCVADGQYRLTHLLENGHALRNGGRAKEYPHIKYGDELARKRLPELIKEAIENANGH